VRRLRATAKWTLRIGTSAALIAWVLSRVDGERLGRALAGVRLDLVAAALALYLVGQTLSAVKWGSLARSVGLGASMAQYGRFYFIGMFLNLVGVSTLGGDVARALYVGEGRRPGLALDSVLFDRASGLAVLVALGALALLAFPEYGFAGSLRAGLVAGGVVLVAAWWTAPRLARRLSRESRIRRRVETELGPFWHDWRLLLRIAALSLVFHLSQVGVQWLLARAAGANVPLAYCLVFHPMLAIVTALPVSIGGFGVREGAYVYFLGRIGVDPAVAVTVGLLWWAVTVLAGLVGGVVFVTSGAELPPLRARPAPPPTSTRARSRRA
jgi:hypothetical protein